KADWHDVRKRAPVRGGEMGNSLLDQESALGLRQHERPQGLALPRGREGCVAGDEASTPKRRAKSHWCRVRDLNSRPTVYKFAVSTVTPCNNLSRDLTILPANPFSTLVVFAKSAPMSCTLGNDP